MEELRAEKRQALLATTATTATAATTTATTAAAKAATGVALRGKVGSGDVAKGGAGLRGDGRFKVKKIAGKVRGDDAERTVRGGGGGGDGEEVSKNRKKLILVRRRPSQLSSPTIPLATPNSTCNSKTEAEVIASEGGGGKVSDQQWPRGTKRPPGDDVAAPAKRRPRSEDCATNNSERTDNMVTMAHGRKLSIAELKTEM